MPTSNATSSKVTFVRDLFAGFVVFLVALPLCLGIALASGAELFTGLLAGIVGGLVVAAISGSQTSVSGPAAGLATIVAAQIAILGSFDAFLLAVVIAGLIQIGFGIAKGGALSAFFPSSVIRGLLVAIGVILILKQLPHVLGHGLELDGKMSFLQPNGETTFSELSATFSGSVHIGAMVIGLLSVAVLFLWDRIEMLKKSLIPAPLLVVMMGVALSVWFDGWGEHWSIGKEHLVAIPIAKSFAELSGFLTLPDFSQFSNPAVYVAAITIAVVASLSTLLSLEAVDKMDPLKRNSPPNRELIAQGCGNVVCGLIGDFADCTSPARGVLVNLVGFKPEFRVANIVRFSHHTTRELKDNITPDRVIEIMREGNHRFVEGKRLNRDLTRQVDGTAEGQFPFAAVLSCIDSRVPTELVFDLGVGDIFSVRVAGNIVGTKTLGSLEYGVGISGVKLVVVLGHTRCGAVTSSVKLICSDQDAGTVTGCGHLQSIVDEIAPSIGNCPEGLLDRLSSAELESYIDKVSKRNVLHTVDEVLRRSAVIRNSAESGDIKVVGAIYNVKTGAIEFLGDEFTEPAGEPARKSFADLSR